jgi:phytoene desaturase
MGGMVKIVEGMTQLATSLGVEIIADTNVEQIIVEKGRAIGVKINSRQIDCDIVLSSADYHHTEAKLLEEKYRNYTEKYWASRVFAPSSILFYLGFNRTYIKTLNGPKSRFFMSAVLLKQMKLSHHKAAKICLF